MTTHQPVRGPASDTDTETGTDTDTDTDTTEIANTPTARAGRRGPDGGDGWLFLSEALRTFRRTGAVAPSGVDLVNALAIPATSRPDQPLSVLEVGAGTGAVTRRLVRVLRAGDRLHVVEPNPRFAQRLRADEELARRGGKLDLRLSTCRVQELPGCGPPDAGDGAHGDGRSGATAERYDVIVSGLPFTNFEPAEVRRILDLYLRLLVPGGELTYFAYLGTSAARLLTSGPRQSARHRAVARLLRRFEEEYGLGSRVVWRNVPPARAHLLRAPGGSRSATGSGPASAAVGAPVAGQPGAAVTSVDSSAGGAAASAR
ncbi:methyltransferase domain-containing protein [Kitasatospora purpeofusca]|uniref:class I SAM-dependent methyltransferase n=1 Tax=Kitasatospora purpeofusca TaxID=67352 RepID=UPI002A5A1950|nr:methyltransferase domain-containing protein [Kitasatospora purpeofusca]MDY0810837.1 methyltransferase domain-containing protein [Kitasatospora purpeofusca]